MGWIFLILVVIVLFGFMTPAIFITAQNETAVNMSESEYETQYTVLGTITTLLPIGGNALALLMGLLGLMIVFILVIRTPHRRRF